jgi:hypothetical protein
MKPSFISHTIVVALLAFTIASSSHGQQTPVSRTLPAGPIRATNAVLNGMALSRGAATTVWFEWGSDASYVRGVGQRGVGHNYLHSTAFLSLPHEQVRYVRPCSHLQPLRDPFQAHRALLPQAQANLHLLTIALAAAHQVVLGPVPPSQFGSDQLLGARFVRLAQFDPVS